jgi:hypothetical protein
MSLRDNEITVGRQDESPPSGLALGSWKSKDPFGNIIGNHR